MTLLTETYTDGEDTVKWQKKVNLSCVSCVCFLQSLRKRLFQENIFLMDVVEHLRFYFYFTFTFCKHLGLHWQTLKVRDTEELCLCNAFVEGPGPVWDDGL